MNLLHSTLTAALLSAAITSRTAEVAPPEPYGPVPTPRQLRWHEMEFYGFLHFTVNTFTDKEWGYGDESPKLFHPTAFDPQQIVRTAREAGMTGLILTAKHHDGFCLWPSQYTEHSVKNSGWKEGKGDVVREISEACRQQGLRFGVYLSPWDRNYKDYGRPGYLTYYRQQLRELLTHYGDIFTVWFDGANGGDGYYGGAREMRRIDNRTYYDWPNTWSIVRELMPMAVMFSDVGPDFRWVGNERGIAGEPCWATISVGNGVPGSTTANLNQGERHGTNWVPAECDVSIRPGWFYHASEDSRVKTPAQLLDIYYKSVGRGACLNLNLPPDRRGQIHEHDVKSLREFRRILDATFNTDLARQARVTASHVRGKSDKYSASHLVDGRRETWWTTDDEQRTAEVELSFPQPVTFNVVSLREHLPLGQRVDEFVLELWKEGGWSEFARGTSIGNRRLLRTSYVTTDRVRLRVTKAAACPALSEFALHAEPVLLAMPRISRDKSGLVTLSSDAPGPHLHYTLDGSEPAPQSPLYERPFPLPKGGTVRVRAFAASSNGVEQAVSEVASRTFDLAKTGWKIVSASYQAPGGGEASRAIDDNAATLWNTHGPQGERPPPQELIIDLSTNRLIAGFTYLPRGDGLAKGIVDKFELYLSENEPQFGKPALTGEFANIKANPVLQTVKLPAPVKARFLRFVATHVAEARHVTAAEIGIVEATP